MVCRCLMFRALTWHPSHQSGSASLHGQLRYNGESLQRPQSDTTERSHRRISEQRFSLTVLIQMMMINIYDLLIPLTPPSPLSPPPHWSPPPQSPPHCPQPLVPTQTPKGCPTLTPLIPLTPTPPHCPHPET